jgi:hypothetical protein
MPFVIAFVTLVKSILICGVCWSIVAIAYRLPEVWIAQQPILIFCYFHQYCTSIGILARFILPASVYLRLY